VNKAKASGEEVDALLADCHVMRSVEDLKIR
jgi:hypothetical protein